jgi:integrase
MAVPALGEKPVVELTADDIRDWRRDLASLGPRARTRAGAPQNYRRPDDDPDEAKRKRQATSNRLLALLKAALNHAWREGRVKGESAWLRVKPYKGAEVARTRFLEVPEAQRLIKACDPEFRILVQAALQSGARYQELARLRVSDFHVARVFDPKTQKKKDVATLHVRKSKTYKARHIYLSPEGQEFFRQLAAGRAGSELLLGREWKASNQDRPMRLACERARIEPRISFHGLRHTYASLATMNGVPLLVVAENLGHSDTRMVEKHYGHLAKEFVADTIRAGAPQFGMVEPSNVKTV